MKRKIVGLLLIAAIVALLAGTVCAGNTTEFMDGSGTAADPYLISNQTHLMNVKLYPSAHFLLLRDLSAQNLGLGSFSGVFDGNGCTITGLTASFTGTLSGEIRNLTLEGTAAGGLFAETVSASGLISGCRSRGTVTGSSAGGICSVAKGTVTLSSNEARVTGAMYAGGIAGECTGTVSRCYNIGTVLTGELGGGITGHGGRVENSFNMGLVAPSSTAKVSCGGISGYISKAVSCYNIGTVKGHYAGGIAGEASMWLESARASMEDCYYLDNVRYSNGFNEGGEAYRCTMEQLTQMETFRKFDFDQVWQPDPGAYGLPVLRGNALRGYGENTTQFAGGEGVFYAPYRITNENQLKNVSLYPDRHYLIAADFSLSRSNWTPLCTGGFLGVLDGNGHTVTGLYDYYYFHSSGGRTRTAGLFADNRGVIRNLTLAEVSLYVHTSDQESRATVGAFAVKSTGGVFENCHVSGGSVTAETYYSTNWGGMVDRGAGVATAGGICGDGSGTFIGCSNAASITAYNLAGGIAAQGTVFTDCLNSGSVAVTATSYGNYYDNVCAGGIAAQGTDLTGCRNTGAVTARNVTSKATNDVFAAGIVARLSGNVTACKNAGAVTAECTWPKSERVSSSPTPYAGGVVATAGSGTSVARCINEGTVKGLAGQNYSSNGYTDAYAGGIAASAAIVTDCLNAGSVSCTNSYYYVLKNYRYCGGIAGSVSTVKNCYTTAQPYGPAEGSLEETVWGYDGSVAGNATAMTNCYFLTTWTSLYPEHGRSEAQLGQQETFVGYDFEKTWGFDLFSDYAYPVPLEFLSAVTEITLNGETELTVLEGMEPDYSGLSVTMKNAAGVEKTSPLRSWMAETADTSVPGTVTVQVSCGGKTAARQIVLTVRAKSPVRLAVKTLPTKTVYEKDELLDLAGGVFTVEYDNQTGKDYAMTKAEVTGFDSASAGEKTLTLTYEGLSTTFRVTVIAPVGIRVKYAPYYAGRDIVNVAPDLIGLVAELVYSDDSAVELPEDEITASYDFSLPGETRVTVHWNGMTAEYETRVWEAVPTYVSLLDEPAKLSYWQGEMLDFSGSLAEICYTVDCAEMYFTRWVYSELTAEMVSGYVPDVTGFQTVRVTYGNCTDDFLVQVKTLITETGVQPTEDGLSVTWRIHENGRTNIYMLAAFREGKMVACAVEEKPANTQFSRLLAGARTGDEVRLFALDDSFRPLIPYTDIGG